MKNKIFLFICCAILLCSGCYEDKGNYDYKNLSKIEVEKFLKEDGTSINVNSSMSVTIGGMVSVRPVLTIANERPNMNFNYTWTFKDKVIGTDETLNWKSDILGSGAVLLDIEDIENGTHFITAFYLTVGEPYQAEGFLILSEKDGIPCLSLLKGIYYDDVTDYELLTGLYQKENGKSLPSDVFKLHEHFCKGSYGSQIMAVCETDLVDINAYTFKEAMRAETIFSGEVPQISDVMFMQWLDLVTDKDGCLYQRRKTTNELFHSQRFLSQPMMFKGETLKNIRIIPDDFSSYRNFLLLYDNHKKRYLVISDLVGTNWSASSDVTTIGKIEEANYSGDEWPEKFTPLNNMKECNVIHTGFFRDNRNTYVNWFFSIFEKNSNYYYQKFMIERAYTSDGTFKTSVNEGQEGKVPALFVNIFNEKSIIAVLEYSEGYGLDSSHPYTFVSSGNSLYLYDIDNLDEDISFKKLLDFDSPVTALDTSCPGGNYLGVGLENGEFYVLRMNQAKNHCEDQDYLVRWHVPAGELGKIKSVRYKTDGNGTQF